MRGLVGMGVRAAVGTVVLSLMAVGSAAQSAAGLPVAHDAGKTMSAQAPQGTVLDCRRFIKTESDVAPAWRAGADGQECVRLLAGSVETYAQHLTLSDLTAQFGRKSSAEVRTLPADDAQARARAVVAASRRLSATAYAALRTTMAGEAANARTRGAGAAAARVSNFTVKVPIKEEPGRAAYWVDNPRQEAAVGGLNNIKSGAVALDYAVIVESRVALPLRNLAHGEPPQKRVTAWGPDLPTPQDPNFNPIESIAIKTPGAHGKQGYKLTLNLLPFIGTKLKLDVGPFLNLHHTQLNNLQSVATVDRVGKFNLGPQVGEAVSTVARNANVWYRNETFWKVLRTFADSLFPGIGGAIVDFIGALVRFFF
jgi:hypothetical protein